MKRSTLKFKYNNVLLIDDNELDNFINEKVVEFNCFAKKVYVTTNGKSALEFINNLLISGGLRNGTFPEVMFVDLNMPLMDGFDFIEQFKKINDSKSLSCKIIILTTSVNNSDKIKAKKIGEEIILVNKPLTNEILDGL